MIWTNAKSSIRGSMNIVEKSNNALPLNQAMSLDLEKNNPDGRNPVMGTSTS